MLNTLQISEILRYIRTFFGVYAINRLPFVLLSKPGAIIINLDASYNPGSHWVCVYLSGAGEGYYFDSFGRPPPALIQSFIERNSRSWTWNHRIYQAEDSTYCGYYCILFALYGPKLYNVLRPCMTRYNESIIKKVFNL